MDFLAALLIASAGGFSQERSIVDDTNTLLQRAKQVGYDGNKAKMYLQKAFNRWNNINFNDPDCSRLNRCCVEVLEYLDNSLCETINNLTLTGLGSGVAGTVADKVKIPILSDVVGVCSAFVALGSCACLDDANDLLTDVRKVRNSV